MVSSSVGNDATAVTVSAPVARRRARSTAEVLASERSTAAIARRYGERSNLRTLSTEACSLRASLVVRGPILVWSTDEVPVITNPALWDSLASSIAMFPDRTSRSTRQRARALIHVSRSSAWLWRYRWIRSIISSGSGTSGGSATCTSLSSVW